MIKNIVLDFGHGGVDNKGNYTTSPYKMHTFENGEVAYEGKINREIGNYLKECLEVHPELNIVCTVGPDDPTDLPLNKRVEIANRFKSNETLFISIHCNASTAHNASGFEIFTTKGITKSDRLAECIANSVEELYKENNITLRYDLIDGDKDKESDFYVIKKTNCPAVLLECGFFDNRKDFDLLKDSVFQNELASKIYLGIINYIRK